MDDSIFHADAIDFRLTASAQQEYILRTILEPRMRLIALFVIALGLAVLTSTASANHPMTSPVEDRYQPKPYITLQHPAWSKHAVLYQINTRQFTPEGTFRAAERELPRLKTLGVDILWLMPVHPIGEKNRKGSLGSPYSVKDYYGVTRG